jgi:hypothetical protein
LCPQMQRVREAVRQGSREKLASAVEQNPVSILDMT